MKNVFDIFPPRNPKVKIRSSTCVKIQLKIVSIMAIIPTTHKPSVCKKLSKCQSEACQNLNNWNRQSEKQSELEKQFFNQL